MALNKYMHPRNPYRSFPNFKQLAIDYPDFRKYLTQDLKGKVKLNFKDENAVRALTTCLLHRDFALSVELPSDHLVPTLPLRLNYILWIEDILSSFKSTVEQARGIDIGTGASCIYPFLGARRNQWSMLGTEIDEESVKIAQDNIDKNNLGHLITVKLVTEDQFLVGILSEEETRYDFMMCNPPFFAEASELEKKGRSEERPPPKNAPTGAPQELVAKGGEVAFVQKIIDDSSKLKGRIRVYTVMLGHKSSVGEVKKELRRVGAASVTSTEFCQGRTMRWGVGWSFTEDLSRVKKLGGLPSEAKPRPPITFNLPKPPISMPFEFTKARLLMLLDELKIIVEAQTDEGEAFGVTIRALENTWMNQRRKKRRLEKMMMKKEGERGAEGQPEVPVEEGVGKEAAPPDTTSATGVVTSDGVASGNSSTADVAAREEEATGKRKISECSEDEPESSVLVATVILYDMDEEFLVETTFIEGTGGREAANQVAQFLKYRLQKLE